MLAQDDLGAREESDRRFQVPSEREDGGRRLAPHDCQRAEATRAAEDLDAGRADPGDGIVDRANNRSIMGQHDIGDRPEPLDSLVIVDAQRLVREVSARTDQGARGVAEQEMMQW